MPKLTFFDNHQFIKGYVILLGLSMSLCLHGAILENPNASPSRTPNSLSTGSTTNTATTAERSTTVRLDLRDGSRIVGFPVNTNLPIRTSLGVFSLALNQIESLQLSQDKTQALVLFRNGDRLEGAFTGNFMELKTCFGPVNIPWTLVQRARISAGGGLPGANLVLYYAFDQKPDNLNFISDKSGQGHDGTLVGSQWTPEGKKGGGCTIHGGIDEITVSNTDELRLEEFSLTIWIKRGRADATSDGSYHAVLFGLGPRSGTLLGLTPDGQPFMDGAEGRRQAIPSKISDLGWHHLAATKLGKTATVYLDGKPAGNVDFDLVADFRNKLSIGSVGAKTGYPFVGTIDDVMIFNRALTAHEIQLLSGEDQ